LGIKSKNIASRRKSDHLDLTSESQTNKKMSDERFMYEPMIGNVNEIDLKVKFLNTTFDTPIWISSMTGGTKSAKAINKNLAKACKQFGMGMGLGSCRQLIDDNAHFEDFDIRKYIGERPLFANLGIAQIEQLIKDKNTKKISELIKKLQATGLIVHVNPMQEFTQSEGDKLEFRPINTIKRLLDLIDTKIIVKEVGQGMGFQSLKELLQLPLAAVDFAAFGGTNFAKLELLRNNNKFTSQYDAFINIGHSADEMIDFVNDIVRSEEIECKEIIISGGIKSFLDGYYYTGKIGLPSIYGMASEFLKYAMGDFAKLEEFILKHIEGLKMAKAFLTIKNKKGA
jgi:isopentenyl-diphosphate delta-isomerase